MPTSGSYPLTHICERVLQLQPTSILDLGSGFGKYGVLMRDYTDIWQNRYRKDSWITKIDAVEGFRWYITGNCLYGVYSHVFVMDIMEFMWTTKQCYDLILCIDVLEHFEKQVGRELVRLIAGKKGREAFICLPIKVGDQKATYGNQLEVHKSSWTKEELEEYGTVTCFRNAYLLHMTRTYKLNNYKERKMAREERLAVDDVMEFVDSYEGAAPGEIGVVVDVGVVVRGEIEKQWVILEHDDGRRVKHLTELLLPHVEISEETESDDDIVDDDDAAKDDDDDATDPATDDTESGADEGANEADATADSPIDDEE